MSKFNPFIKKLAYAALILAIGAAVLPTSNASAASHEDKSPSSTALIADNPTGSRGNLRLERLWMRTQHRYQQEGHRLAKAMEFIDKVQLRVDEAAQKGWDTSAVQASLNAFASVIPAAQTAHDPGAAIIASHNGFDADGVVIDRTSAIATVKSLAQVLKDTRSAMNSTGKALREAVKAFREAHKPAP